MDKARILVAMQQLGYRQRDVAVVLEKLNDQQLLKALALVRDFRASVFQQNIHPVLTRAALKFALYADTKVIRETGKNLLFYDRLTELILIQLVEDLKE